MSDKSLVEGLNTIISEWMTPNKEDKYIKDLAQRIADSLVIDEDLMKHYIAQEIPVILRDTYYKGEKIKYDCISTLEEKLKHCAKVITANKNIIRVKE